MAPRPRTGALLPTADEGPLVAVLAESLSKNYPLLKRTALHKAGPQT